VQAEELDQVGREAILAKRRGEKPCVTSAVPALWQESFRLIGRRSISILTARAANSATIQQREQRLQHHQDFRPARQYRHVRWRKGGAGVEG
jgi:hypothetical protein